MKKFTPDDYVLACVDEYPSLYSASTFERAKLRVYDQLFNVIGNGLSTSDLKYRKFNRDRALRFCNGEQAYYGYFKSKKIGDFEMGEGESITVGEWERDNHPEVVFWMDCGYCSWRPYPNFNKQYSIIWESDFKEIAGPKWVAEAVWYYKKCREWLENNEHEYHGAYPTGDDYKDARYLEDMKKQRERYESDEDFSKAYNIEYTGDMVDFMKRRWQANKEKIFQYIDETIAEFGK